MVLGKLENGTCAYISGNSKCNRSRRKYRRSSLSSRSSSVCAEYLQNSTIHGCKELGRTDKAGLRVFWAAVIVLCMAGVSYEIYQIINYYSGKPGATQISWNVRDSYDYPPIAFCPKRWLRMDRARKLGLTDEQLAYAVSLIQFDVTVKEDFDEDKVRAQLSNIMQRNNISTYLDLIIAIGYEADGLLRIMSTPSEIELKPFVPSFGLCYLMELKPILANTLRTSMLLRFAYEPPEKMNESQLYDRRLQPHMLVRDSSGVKPNFITFSQKAIYQIDFEAQVYRRISRQSKPCLTELPNKDYHVGMCELLCIKQETARRGCGTCYNVGLTATLNMTMSPDKKPCTNYDRVQAGNSSRRRRHAEDKHGVSENSTTSLDAEVHSRPHDGPFTHSGNGSSSGESQESQICSEKALAEGTTTCTSKCMPPCEQWVYKHTTNVLSDDSGDEIVIWVAYNPIDGILWYEEVPTYTVDTFISNIGGQLGLWLGASVISIIQVLYYCCLTVWRRRPSLIRTALRQTVEVTAAPVVAAEKECLPLV